MSTSVITLFVITQTPLPPPLPPPSLPPTSPYSAPDDSPYFLYWMIPTLSALGFVLIILFCIAIQSRLPTFKLFTKNFPVENTIQEINSIELSVKPLNDRKIREQTYSRR